MKTNIILFTLLAVGGLFIYNKLNTQSALIASYESELHSTQESLASLQSSMATQKSVKELKDQLNLVLAQSTLKIEANTQVSINSINELKEQLKDESKKQGRDVNVLSRHTVEWLQRYEKERKH